MNFHDMRTEFDRIQRTLEDVDFREYRDDYLNQSWLRLTQMFVMPSLIKTVLIDSVASQDTYQFPYDYNGTEIFLWYKNTTSGTYRRLDPVKEDVLALMYERRSWNMGVEMYYDWTAPVGSDYAVRSCVLVNNSATVLCATAAAADVDKWIRFDPFTVGTVTYSPGDYGYYISTVTAGVSYTLDRTYRGPAGTTNGRVRPSEQQQFILYGNPSSAVDDAFKLRYYAQPKRLFNDADVPEWPSMGMPIVQFAVSIAYDYLHASESAKVWYGRMMGAVQGLQRRIERSSTLVTDLTIGSVSGRKTGARSVDTGRRFSYSMRP
jgi:hypothetical protein